MYKTSPNELNDYTRYNTKVLACVDQTNLDGLVSFCVMLNVVTAVDAVAVAANLSIGKAVTISVSENREIITNHGIRTQRR